MGMECAIKQINVTHTHTHTKKRGSWLGTECAIKQIDVWSLQDLKEFLDEVCENILSKRTHPKQENTF